MMAIFIELGLVLLLVLAVIIAANPRKKKEVDHGPYGIMLFSFRVFSVFRG